ncbi:latent-transforming growth factor beta-binding protein 2-like [Rhopilema esculentum]|uniref:latent-transforming growth factor beta-binding protein 2-like n=1 Tax=Rhopilema esculentum TaxID=499914 RepID=UPI0031E31D8C
MPMFKKYSIYIFLAIASFGNVIGTTLAPEECKNTVTGQGYRGLKQETKAGIPCQRWDVHSPHSHMATTAATYPNAGLEENYCRNPDHEPGGPWCYTLATTTRWAYCDVPKCPNAPDCKDTIKGGEYRGFVNTTREGLTCQQWGAQSPHQHSVTNAYFPGKGVYLNYCRNPDGEPEGPWCYTTSPSVRMQYCNVPLCDEEKVMCAEITCQENAKCMKIDGTYQCGCKQGYTGTASSCQDINECSNSELNECSQVCINNGGGYNCSCQQGYTLQGRGTCIDIDECLTANCHTESTCTNTNGAYSCNCNSGFVGNGTICEDDDECLKSPCHSNATCSNSFGSFNCSCKQGLIGNGTECEDVNECLESPCHDNATCLNTFGSFQCTCKEGFFGNGTECEDVNECLESPCHDNATCLNTFGSFQCSCKEGFFGNGTECEDVNECLESPCHDNATCLNTFGSFQCSCKEGFFGNGTECEDVNECLESPCHDNATCLNTFGSFQCTCKEGFFGNGTECEDVNECLENLCHKNATCQNMFGTYQCTCKEGFSGNGIACVDVNECLKNLCHDNATCQNTLGSFQCNCKEGFSGNGTACVDINECLDNPCHTNATCTNALGSFQCTCATGLSGNGFSGESNSCYDENECFQNPCHVDATCFNTVGSFECICNIGFKGDGNICEKEVVSTNVESSSLQMPTVTYGSKATQFKDVEPTTVSVMTSNVQNYSHQIEVIFKIEDPVIEGMLLNLTDKDIINEILNPISDLYSSLKNAIKTELENKILPELDNVTAITVVSIGSPSIGFLEVKTTFLYKTNITYENTVIESSIMKTLNGSLAGARIMTMKVGARVGSRCNDASCNNATEIEFSKKGSDNISLIIGACIAASGLFLFGFMLCRSKKGQNFRKQTFGSFSGRNSVTPSEHALSKLGTESSSICKEADDNGSLYLA